MLRAKGEKHVKHQYISLSSTENLWYIGKTAPFLLSSNLMLHCHRGTLLQSAGLFSESRSSDTPFADIVVGGVLSIVSFVQR